MEPADAETATRSDAGRMDCVDARDTVRERTVGRAGRRADAGRATDDGRDGEAERARARCWVWVGRLPVGLFGIARARRGDVGVDVVVGLARAARLRPHAIRADVRLVEIRGVARA